MIKKIGITLAILIVNPLVCCADWIGSQEIVSGAWGSENGQFHLSSGDTVDSFPRNFGIDSSGKIIVGDLGNKRIQIFNNSGSLYKVVSKPGTLPISDSLGGWPDILYVFPGGNCLIMPCESVKSKVGYKYTKECILNYEGSIIKKISYGEVLLSIDGFFILNHIEKKYYKYSSTGTLISTSPTKPPELGQVTE